MIVALIIVALAGLWLVKLLSEKEEVKRVRNKKWIVIAGIILAVGVLGLSTSSPSPFIFIGGFVVAILGGLLLLKTLREKAAEQPEKINKQMQAAQLVMVAGGIMIASSFSPLPIVLALGLALAVFGGLWLWKIKRTTTEEAEAQIKKGNKATFAIVCLAVGGVMVLGSFVPHVLPSPTPEPVIAQPVPQATTPAPEPTPEPILTLEEEILQRFFGDEHILLAEGNLFSNVTVLINDSELGSSEVTVLGFSEDGNDVLILDVRSEERERWYSVVEFTEQTFGSGDVWGWDVYHLRAIRIDDPALFAAERTIMETSESLHGFIPATEENLFSGVRVYWKANPEDPDEEAEHWWTIIAFGNEGGLMENQILAADGGGWETWDTYDFFTELAEGWEGAMLIREDDPALERAERETRATEADEFRRITSDDISRVGLAQHGGALRVYVWNSMDGSIGLGGTVLERVSMMQVSFWDVNLVTREVSIEYIMNNFVVRK